MAEKNRKLYLGLKASIKELFTEHVRWIKESNVKESAFEKPYLAPDYRKMHLEIPKPEWPELKKDFPDLDPWKPGGIRGGGGKTKNCPGCLLYIDHPGSCENPVEVHAAVYCTDTPQAPTDRWVKLPQNFNPNISSDVPNPDGIAAGDTTLEVWAEKGEISVIDKGAYSYIGPSLAVYLNTGLSEHTICGRLIDGLGNVCTECIDVTCKDCTSPLTFDDDSTSDTIVSGSNITIYILNGWPPFQWSVSGTGATWNKSGSNTLTSSVRAEQLNLADGDCGVDYAATLDVSITDDCGVTVSTTIRSTGDDAHAPDWASLETKSAVVSDPCYAVIACAAIPNNYDYIEGAYKWNLVHGGAYCEFGTPSWQAGSYPPACGGPIECNPLGGCSGCSKTGGQCSCSSYTAYHWECT